MNYCEYLRAKITRCENEIRNTNNENLKQFWLNAKLGFEKRLCNATIAELEKVVK